MNNNVFNLYVPEDEHLKPHYYACEELLSSFANRCDYQRLNLFSSHITQLLHLKNPEYPKVFTNFETQIGSLSTAYKKAEGNLRVIARVVKNKYNYSLIVQDVNTEIYDIINYQTSKHIAEEYGYVAEDCIGEIEEGVIIPKDTFLWKSNDFDDDGNVGYGVNLRAAYFNKENRTYEDGILVSESAARKLTSYSVKKIMVSINDNDILLNVHGDESNYKSLPKIGDKHGMVLCALRKKANRTIFYDLQDHILRDIDPVNDTVIYSGGGIITDVKVFSNKPLHVLKKQENINYYTQELIDLYEEDYNYHKRLAEVLEDIIPVHHRFTNEQNIAVPISGQMNPNKYTDNLAFQWKVSHEYINNKLKWKDDFKEFGYMKVEFTVLHEDILAQADKITGQLNFLAVVFW